MPSIRETPLVGSAEAAKLLQIGATNFSHLRRKLETAGDETFPQPITQLQCGPIWLKSDMDKFKKHYDGRRRRVRSTNGDAHVEETAPAPKTKAPVKKAAAAKAEPKARSARNKAEATVTDIAAKPKRLKVKAG